MRLLQALLAIGILMSAACHPGPVLDTGPKQSVGGTIAGIVSTDANSPVVGRKVTAINVSTNTRYDATTGSNGGYTIKVPEGTYRIELTLQPGEAISKQPADTKINNSDLDPHRDFVITAKRTAD
jgi:Carboxypeptidase regulatory-like domain